MMFPLSAVATAATFFGVGILKGGVLRHPPLRSGLETLLVGGAAAAMAYAVGILLRNLVGTTLF
jgi:VIT1/CCC1 family predicted Fe2+/Mn2+ transporter